MAGVHRCCWDVHDVYLRLKQGLPVSKQEDVSYMHAQEYLQAHRGENDTYWNGYTRQLPEREDLSSLLRAGLPATAVNTHRHIIRQEELSVVMGATLHDALKALAAAHGVTLNAILQYCWHKQLRVYGNTAVTVVGMTVSGRNLPVDDIEQSVGLFINTLPVIMTHSNGAVISEIRQLQAHINEVNSRSDVSLAKLQQGGERMFNNQQEYLISHPNTKTSN
jgi:hypothetical protein